MKVMFYKLDGGRLCGWSAEIPKRKRFQGTVMASGKDLPHDLAHFVVEASLGIQNGFWGLVAKGATFKSIKKKATKPGRGLIRENCAELDASEHHIGVHMGAWKQGLPTPLKEALDQTLVRWKALRIGEELVMNWPGEKAPRPRKTAAAAG